MQYHTLPTTFPVDIFSDMLGLGKMQKESVTHSNVAMKTICFLFVSVAHVPYVGIVKKKKQYDRTSIAQKSPEIVLTHTRNGYNLVFII